MMKAPLLHTRVLTNKNRNSPGPHFHVSFVKVHVSLNGEGGGGGTTQTFFYGVALDKKEAYCGIIQFVTLMNVLERKRRIRERRCRWKGFPHHCDRPGNAHRTTCLPKLMGKMQLLCTTVVSRAPIV